MLNFQLIGNTLPKNDYRLLLEEIKKLGKNFNFFAEARAGQLKGDDYRLMRESGFTNIQTGIESLSQNYLKKINKGVRLIDNIVALKFCKEYGIKNEYNIIVNYPNEEKIDFEETKGTIQLIKHLDQLQINKLLVGYGSYVYNNPEMFNIEKFEYTEIDKVMFPEEILEKGISFFYNFKRKDNLGENNWNEVGLTEGRIESRSNELLLYCVDGRDFLKIYDRRDATAARVIGLNKFERDILLSCMDLISYQELRKLCSHISDDQFQSILTALKNKGIIFNEENHFFALPLREAIVRTSSNIQVAYA